MNELEVFKTLAHYCIPHMLGFSEAVKGSDPFVANDLTPPAPSSWVPIAEN